MLRIRTKIETEEFRKKLSNKPLKNLKRMAKLLKYPIRSNATKQEIIHNLAQFIESPRIWASISNPT